MTGEVTSTEPIRTVTHGDVIPKEPVGVPQKQQQVQQLMQQQQQQVCFPLPTPSSLPPSLCYLNTVVLDIFRFFLQIVSNCLSKNEIFR